MNSYLLTVSFKSSANLLHFLLNFILHIPERVAKISDCIMSLSIFPLQVYQLLLDLKTMLSGASVFRVATFLMKTDPSSL